MYSVLSSKIVMQVSTLFPSFLTLLCHCFSIHYLTTLSPEIVATKCRENAKHFIKTTNSSQSFFLSPPIWLFVEQQRQQLWGGSCRQRPLTWRKRNTSAVFYQDSHINNSAAPVICKWLNLLTCRDQFTSILGLFRPNGRTILLLQYIPLLFFSAFFSINTIAAEAEPSSRSNTWSTSDILTTFYFVWQSQKRKL